MMRMPVPKGVAKRTVTRFGKEGPADDDLVVEEPLEIRVAGDTLAVTMRTPGDDRFLAVGFLYAEGVIESVRDVGSIAHCGRPGEEGYGNTIDLVPAAGADLDIEKVAATRRGTLTTAACGVCGRRSVDDVIARCTVLAPGPIVSAALVTRSVARLRERQPLFTATGGIHAAAVLDARGEVLATFEDIGRHNAIDKAIGKLVLEGRVPLPPGPRAEGSPAVLVVSGRASFEVAQKAAQARIPIVAGVSAASSLAVDLARATGVTLCGFVRGDSMTVYAHPERIAG
ncbi:MAG: formate dehydrogenase accessory sulfurtransferase FdhD [Myxococcales bacterium]